MTSTDGLACTRPPSRMAWSAATPEIGAAAACSKLTRDGLNASASTGTATNSARAPA